MAGYGLAKKGLGLLGRKLKHSIKRTKKMPNKNFKHVDLKPTAGGPHVKGSVGKKNYINELKRTTLNRTRKAAGGILKGIGKIVKGPANKWRMEKASHLKKHRLKTKIEKAREGRLQSKVKSNLDKKIASNPDLKKAVSQQKHPKSWRRHQQKGTK